MSKSLDLSEFAEISFKAWKQKIQFELKGADYNQTMLWESLEGIHVKPFYHFDEEKKPDLHFSKPSDAWKIVDTFFVKNEKLARKNMLKSIENGATGIRIQADETFDIEKTFSGFPFEEAAVFCQFSFFDLAFTERLIHFFKLKKAHFFLNLDPIGRLINDGNWFENETKDFENIKRLLSMHPEQKLLSIDAVSHQQAGANMVEQLAFAMAHLNEYFNPFSNLCSAAVNIQFAVGSNYFFEIAKLRAFRILYAALAVEYGLPETCHIFVVPTLRNKTIYDYNVNMLRTTTECMSAVLGSADAVCNLPYDALFHKENEFGHRIARNQLLILKNESFFDAVSNPADGSYYIESITAQLAEKALLLFKEIEKKGGFIKQLKNGFIQKRIMESHQKEQELYNLHREVLVGTTQYTNQEDRMKENLELFPFLKTKPRKTLIKPLIPKRISASVEQERLALEK
jgi:methylmalonyl-CoA mutase